MDSGNRPGSSGETDGPKGPEEPREAASGAMADLPLFETLGTDGPEGDAKSPDESPLEAATQPVSAHGGMIERPATLTDRLGAALLDLGVMVAVGVALLIGSALLGSRLSLEDWPAFVLPWVAFSFVYYVLPLSFWGRTPGMASLGLRARSLDGGPLSFVQAFYRWLGTLLTTALVGLPGLLAFSGRSATDRLSGSVTLWQGRRDVRKSSGS